MLKAVREVGEPIKDIKDQLKGIEGSLSFIGFTCVRNNSPQSASLQLHQGARQTPTDGSGVLRRARGRGG